MMIASFILFMFLHGSAVCDELYPISVVEDIAQYQPEWSSDNYIEHQQGKSYDEAFPASNSPLSDRDQTDLAFIKKEIVEGYNFEKDPMRDIWTKQPDFKGVFETSQFKNAAKKVEKFFERNNDWDTTKTNQTFRTRKSCINLLYITAARYLLVTHILYVESNKALIPCKRSRNKKIVIPDSGVCYPVPYGSATCTSDYDVGLIGKDAGYLTEKFNNYFQRRFGKPSELVFDTNVYAFTLEFAMPFLFAKLQINFTNSVTKNEQATKFKMQELASAYYKVFKYRQVFFQTMVDGAKRTMTAAKSKAELTVWMETFRNLNEKVPMKLENWGNSAKEMRKAHNDEYQKHVKNMSIWGGYKSRFLDDLAKALIYAAEAYHTRGAIRHVVGGTQMKIIDTSKSLTTNDLWVSMIENWGESIKEFNHCNSDRAPLEECFLKMSKYMWRLFNAMRLVREKLPPRAKVGLLHFGEKFADPEFAMKMWLDYKKQGKTAIRKHKGNIREFLRQFRCNAAGFGAPLSLICMSKINAKVNEYNKKLAGLVTDEPVRRPWRP